MAAEPVDKEGPRSAVQSDPLKPAGWEVLLLVRLVVHDCSHLPALYLTSLHTDPRRGHVRRRRGAGEDETGGLHLGPLWAPKPVPGGIPATPQLANFLLVAAGTWLAPPPFLPPFPPTAASLSISCPPLLGPGTSDTFGAIREGGTWREFFPLCRAELLSSWGVPAPGGSWAEGALKGP